MPAGRRLLSTKLYPYISPGIKAIDKGNVHANIPNESRNITKELKLP